MPRASLRTTAPNLFLGAAVNPEPVSADVSATSGEEAPVANSIFMVGDYLVGDGEDAKLGGHPDIRY